MIVLDASVWISSIQVDETNHAVSMRWRETWLAKDNVIAVPTHFLVEITSAFTRRPDGSEAAGLVALDGILDEPLIVRFDIDEDLAELAARAAARCRIRAGDALYVALAQQLEVPLVTWDDQLLDRARVLVDVRVPTA